MLLVIKSQEYIYNQIYVYIYIYISIFIKSNIKKLGLKPSNFFLKANQPTYLITDFIIQEFEFFVK